MIIYTCITNSYDTIPKNHYYDSEVQYVCFTDGTVDVPSQWEKRSIPIEHDCPLRLSLYPKIMQHKVFPLGSQVVWIDGCYVITKEYVEYCKKIFDKYTRAHIVHPIKFTYYEEITESFIAEFNSKDDIMNITTRVKELGFDFKQYVNPMCATFWNTVTKDAIKFNEMWWDLSQISTRCDQIAFVVSKYFNDINWKQIEDISDIGTNLSSLDHRKGETVRGNIGRVKKHPKNGESNQWMIIDDMIREVSKLTRMPKLYLKDGKVINRNYHWKDIRNVREFKEAKT